MDKEIAKPTVPLKLMLDVKKTRVLAAEATRDFIEVLLSFLTLPLGTIIRVTNSHPGTIGCMNNLYQSIQKLNKDIFWTEACKSILLSPKNPHSNVCKDLKLNIDDSSNGESFKCNSCMATKSQYPNTNTRCGCGGVIRVEKYVDAGPKHFVKEGMMFLVTDDLRVLPGCPSSLAQFLCNLGINDVDKINEIYVDVGLEEVSKLLKRSLLSQSPLTDVFVLTQDPVDKVIVPQLRNSPSSYSESQRACDTKLSMTLIFSKSKNKILGVEAREEFTDFLLSFTTIPLGSVVKLLDGDSGLGCIDNLYKTVKSLDSEWFAISRDEILNAGVDCTNKCNVQLLQIPDARNDMANLDPRSPDGDHRFFGKFVKRPHLFVVSDNLVLSPSSSTSSICFLKELNVPLDDIEQRVVTIREPEALALLKACLTSTAALANGLESLMKKRDWNLSKSYDTEVRLPY